jgi:ATP synthase protein I
MSSGGKKRSILQVADLVNMGMAMALCVVLGLALGVYLDGKFGTEPILTLLLLLFGLLAGFRYMYKTYMRFFGEELKGDDHKHG